MTMQLPPVAKYEAFIWDFDGTLVDLALDWDLLKDRLVKLVPSASSRILRDLLATAQEAGLREQAYALVGEMEREALESRKGWMAPTIEVFTQTQAASVVVTNNVSTTIERFFELVGLPAVPYVARDMVTEPKPNPEGALSLVEHWQGKQCLLIGDTAVDASLAERLGVDFFRVERPERA